MRATRAPKSGDALPAGFTLLELLVAVAISVVIMAALAFMLARIMTGWERTQGRLAAEAEALHVLELLTLDLQGARGPDGPGIWLAATVQGGGGASGAWVGGAKQEESSVRLDAEPFRTARFGRAGMWLRCITTRRGGDARSAEPTAPAAVAYQLIRRAPTAGSTQGRYLLYRSEATASATFAGGYDLSAAAYTTASVAAGSAGSLVSPPLRALLAEEVVDFGVRFSRDAQFPGADGTSLIRLFPKAGGTLEYAVGGDEGVTAGHAPRLFVADVLLRILSPEGARRIAALESGQLTGDWWQIAESESYVFTRRILLPLGGR